MNIKNIVPFIFVSLLLCSCNSTRKEQQTDNKSVSEQMSNKADSIEFRGIAGVYLGMTPEKSAITLLQQGYNVKKGMVNGKVQFAGLVFDSMMIFADSGLVDYISIDKLFRDKKEAMDFYLPIEKAYDEKYMHFFKEELQDPDSELPIKGREYDDGRIKVLIGVSIAIDGSSYSVNITYEKSNKKECINKSQI